MEKKPAVLIVTENLNVGGAEKYTVLVANELYARGYRVIVFANKGPFRERIHPSIRFVRAHFESGMLGFLHGVFQIIRISLEERVVLVHAQKLESSKAAWVARFFTGVPVIKTAHGYTRKELLTLGKRINRYSDVVVTVVDWLVSELQKNGVAEHKLRLIYNGMIPMQSTAETNEIAALRTTLGINENDRVIVSVSRLERGKNHAEFLTWLPRILAQVPNARYLIVGSGPEREPLEQKVRDLGLQHAVFFVEGTTYAEPYLQLADIFCTPTVAQGMAVLEAMTAGLPVVGTAPTGGPEVVVHEETGFVVPKHDGDAFVEALITLLEDPIRAKHMGALGKERQAQLFSITKTVDALEEAYASVFSFQRTVLQIKQERA